MLAINDVQVYSLAMENSIFSSIPFWAGVAGVMIAQLLKPFIHYVATKEFNPRLIFINGGMPSSHTSGICAITTAIGMTNGFASDIFVLSFAISMIIMNDAMNVRLETGKQAQLLNEWSEVLEELFSDKMFSRQHFKTMVGHTIVQVFWGLILGVAIGIGVFYLMR